MSQKQLRNVFRVLTDNSVKCEDLFVAGLNISWRGACRDAGAETNVLRFF